MITDFDYLIKWIDGNNIKNFRVVQKGKTTDRNNGAEFYTQQDESDESKKERLREWYENSEGGIYVVEECGKNCNNAAIDFKVRYNKPVQDNISNCSNISNVPNVPDGFISEKQVQTMLENERLKMRLEKLEDDLKNVQNENRELNKHSDAVGKFLETITPFVAPVISGILKKPVAPTQIGTLDNKEAAEEESENLDLTDEEFKTLCNDLREWKEADKDYLLIIHKLAGFTKNPLYDTAKGMLFNS